MSVLRRWLQPSFRKALAAEAAGELEEAARFYALSGQRDKVADMHLRLAERSIDGLGRIQSLRNALDWLDHDADVRVVEVALASAILARAKVEGTTGARDVELLEEGAMLFEEREELGRAAEAYELLGRRQDVARCYERGGHLEKLETLLTAEQAKESDARTARLMFQEYEMEREAGGRDRALVALRRAAALAGSSEGYDDLLRKFERRFPVPGRVDLRVGAETITIIGRLPVVLGRVEADIPLRHAGISRKHARISRSGDRYWLDDLSSRNGTRLEGALLAAPLPLPTTGTIGLGDACRIHFSEKDGALELEVVEGLDRGQRFLVVDRRWDVPDAACFVQFDKTGQARMEGAEPLLLNGKRTAEPIVLLRGDVIESGTARIEVLECLSGDG